MKRVILLNHKGTDSATYSVVMVQHDHQIVFNSVALQLPWRDNKKGISRVPAGVYDLVFEMSPAFNRYLWEIKGVPGRSECKFHTANYVRQLNGCIAPGDKFADIDHDGIYDVLSSDATLKKFHAALDGETKVKIHIIDVD